MDTLNIHLPPVIPDSYYDIPNHSHSTYQTSYSTPSWAPRDEPSRPFHNHGAEFDAQPRCLGNIEARECAVGHMEVVETDQDDVIADVTENDWTDKDDDVTCDESGHERGQPRQSQVAVTLQWLSENYERAEGVCLPRCVLYQHYLDLCKKMKFTPAGAATFGKIIRQRFPKLTTRRLGTRGQSKYHYYGIGIKESSIYYHSVYSGKGLTRFSGIKLKTEGSSRKYSLSSKTGTLLPEFPNADNLLLPPGTELDKMRTFIMMYRTHCQRMLDTVISANFEEVQNFLVHFWQGMPEHMLDLLTCDILPDIVAVCDSVLYKVLLDVLIPSSIQDMPSTLFAEMRLFAKHLPFWIESAMETVSKPILEKKQEVAKVFIQSLRRQSSFVSLAQTARTVISNQELLTQMVADISSADFVDICSQAGFMDPSANPKFCMKMQNFYSEFKELLGKQSPIEGYTEWIDDIVEKHVLKVCGEDHELFREKASEFLLHWGAFSGLLMRELTLQNASSFVSIHIVHLMLDEYTFLVVETQQDIECDSRLQRALQKHMKNAEEIHIKPAVRKHVNKSINSPKAKKRRHTEEFEGKLYAIDSAMLADDNRITSSSNVEPLTSDHMPSNTAFIRPLPTTTNSKTMSDHDSSRSDLIVHAQQNIRPHNGAISVPPMKPYQPYNNTFDRPTYLPQFGISSYPDYMSHNPSFGSSRIPNYSEAYSQTFSSNPFTSNITSNLPSVGGNYWSDARSTHSFSDPYQHYNYNKLNATYDSLNKTALLRNNAYQDSISRQAFDSSISSYYRSPHDNLQVGTPLQVGTYGTNFMDIAPPAGQYCYQDDLFAGSFAKPFLTGPFR